MDNIAIVHLDVPATLVYLVNLANLVTLAYPASLKRSDFRRTGRSGAVRYYQAHSEALCFNRLQAP